MAKATAQEERHTKPIYGIYGDEDFLKLERVSEIRRAILGHDDMGYSEFDGATARPADVFDELRTLSFFATRRVVVVRGADVFISRYREALEKYLAAPSESGSLVLVCKTLDARTRVFKLIQQKGETAKCDPLKGAALTSWISNRAAKPYGVRIEPSASARLKEFVGDNLGELDAELMKLTVYIGQRRVITDDDVVALVGTYREEKIWGITDAIAGGDAKKALGLWEQVWSTDRSAPALAIGGIAWGVRRLLQAKRDARSGTPMMQLAKSLWTDPATLKRRLDAFSEEQIEAQLAGLLEADLAAKTGLGDVHSEIEKFIVMQCAAAKR